MESIWKQKTLVAQEAVVVRGRLKVRVILAARPAVVVRGRLKVRVILAGILILLEEVLLRW